MERQHGTWRIVERECVDSTNSEAGRLVDAGELAAHPALAVVARRQTAGKGRAERAWHSPAGGGLWFSLAIAPRKEPEHLAQITLLAAVAVAEAVTEETGVALGIKWPNDLLYGDRKVCGILTETRPAADDDGAASVPVIVGIGLNVNQNEGDFPPELCDTATSLAVAAGKSLDGMRIFHKILEKFHTWYELWLAEGFEPVRQKWIGSSCTMRRLLSWEEGGKRRSGTAVDLETDGSLRVCMDDGAIHLLNAGEIRFLRASPMKRSS